MIQLEHISKIFQSGCRQVHAVDNVSLNIRPGEIFGIIGFSGAGKSTLVRCINLLERPTSGRVIVDGEDLTAMGQRELRLARIKIGMIFQHFNLLQSRTVWENVAFPLRKSSLSQAEQADKINALLSLVGLADKADAYPSQLSGGQKQRVAIARALANDPKVLLCDEATSALDPQTTRSILGLLRQVNERLGITIVLITHEMAVVKDICDRVAVMENGRVVEQGKALDIFVHPEQKVTRNFISTADNMDKIFQLIDEGHEITKLLPGEKLVLLTYSGDNASEALISKLAETYGVTANIIFGSIDILKGEPIGKLMVVLHGSPSSLEKAVSYIRERNVRLEVIRE